MQRARFFQIFGCRTGFLCLELTHKTSGVPSPVAFFRWLAAFWFGPLAIIAHIIMVRRNAKRKTTLDLSNALLSNDELVELARQRKRSFVAQYDEIKWARIEPADTLERMLYGGQYQGTITFREKTVGKVTIQVYDQQCMETAIDAFSDRLPDVADIRAEFDLRQHRYVVKR